MILTIEQAKQALDMVLGKGRSHMYKPIQVAEILYRDRVKGGCQPVADAFRENRDL